MAILPLRIAKAVLAVPPGPSQWPPERSVRRKRATVHPRTSTARSSAAPQGSDSFHCRTAVRVRRRSGSGPLRTMTGREKNEAAASSLVSRSAFTQPRIVATEAGSARRVSAGGPEVAVCSDTASGIEPDPPPPPPPQPASAGTRAPSAERGREPS